MCLDQLYQALHREGITYEEQETVLSKIVPNTKEFTIYYPIIPGCPVTIPITYNYAEDRSLGEMLVLIGEFYESSLNEANLRAVILALSSFTYPALKVVLEKYNNGEVLALTDFRDSHCYLDSFLPYGDKTATGKRQGYTFKLGLRRDSVTP